MNRRNLTILAAVMFIVTLGFGMVMPIFPFYIESMGASGTELGLLLAISPIMQIIFSPFWGTLSDAHGRKPILAVGIFGYAISLFLYGLSTQLWMLFAARGGQRALFSNHANHLRLRRRQHRRRGTRRRHRLSRGRDGPGRDLRPRFWRLARR